MDCEVVSTSKFNFGWFRRMSASLIVSFAPIGWQRLRLAKALFTHNSIFRHAVHEVAKFADPQLPKPLVTVLYSEDDEATIQRPVYSLLIVFAVEYALYQLVAFDSPCAPSGLLLPVVPGEMSRDAKEFKRVVISPPPGGNSTAFCR